MLYHNSEQWNIIGRILVYIIKTIVNSFITNIEKIVVYIISFFIFFFYYFLYKIIYKLHFKDYFLEKKSNEEEKIEIKEVKILTGSIFAKVLFHYFLFLFLINLEGFSFLKILLIKVFSFFLILSFYLKENKYFKKKIDKIFGEIKNNYLFFICFLENLLNFIFLKKEIFNYILLEDFFKKELIDKIISLFLYLMITKSLYDFIKLFHSVSILFL